jgi:hypothetical protein
MWLHATCVALISAQTGYPARSRKSHCQQADGPQRAWRALCMRD